MAIAESKGDCGCDENMLKVKGYCGGNGLPLAYGFVHCSSFSLPFLQRPFEEPIGLLSARVLERVCEPNKPRSLEHNGCAAVPP